MMSGWAAVILSLLLPLMVAGVPLLLLGVTQVVTLFAIPAAAEVAGFVRWIPSVALLAMYLAVAVPALLSVCGIKL